MKFVFFSVSENGENGLSDEGADGCNASKELLAQNRP